MNTMVSFFLFRFPSKNISSFYFLKGLIQTVTENLTRKPTMKFFISRRKKKETPAVITNTSLNFAFMRVMASAAASKI